MSAARQSPGRVLVFARAPVAGASKTRLIPALGAEGAAQISLRLLHRTLETACAYPVELWCTPSVDHPIFVQCAQDFPVTLREQRGADLGQRMLSAFDHALAHAPWAVLVGCDCPELTRLDLEQAASALQEGAGAVLGPAEDGGYYLIGLREPEAALFEAVDWGTDRVLEQTRLRLDSAGWDWHELPVRKDLDRPEDLRHFPWLGGPSADAAC